MDKIFIGTLVNTHGLNGEVRIISDFKYKEDVFKVNNSIYINNEKYIINSYRTHKIYDMVTLSNINTIDDALKLKGEKVYIDKCEYNFSGYLDSDLMGLSVYDNDKYMGKVIDILKTVNNDILVIEGTNRHMVPNIPEFVKYVDIKNKRIEIKYIKGLDYED